MNYYDFHVGDFRSATSHLTRIERSIYRDMIDMYYDTEEPLPLDLKTLNRKLAARSEEEQQAVIALLDEFFIKTESGYFNSRCDEEIQKYHNNQSKKSIAGKASAAKREQERLARLAVLNGQSADVQQNNGSVGSDDQQGSTGVQQVLDSSSSSVQLTNNQKPITNNQKETNVSKNSLSQNAGEVDDDENWNQPDPPILVDGWQPDFNEIQGNLRDLGFKPCDQTKLDRVLTKFKKSRRGQYEPEGALELALCNWINNEREPAQPRGKAAAGQQAEPQRTTDTTNLRERKFEDYHDSQKYSGVFTAGQIRENLQDGETPDECVLRLTKAMLARAGESF